MHNGPYQDEHSHSAAAHSAAAHSAAAHSAAAHGAAAHGSQEEGVLAEEKAIQKTLISPQPLSGFEDWLPQHREQFDHICGVIIKLWRHHGYRPIETPSIYRLDTLTKHGDDIERQLFHWKGPDSKRHLALRFDLTVPLARYVAANEQHLPMPFRRYHIAKVWRGERAQKGRLKEFYQCDIDIIGTYAHMADVEIISLCYRALSNIGFKKLKVLVNHRGILNGIFNDIEIPDKERPFALRNLDKIDKIGSTKVLEILKNGDPQHKGLIPSLLERFESFLKKCENTKEDNNALFTLIENDYPSTHKPLEDLKALFKDLQIIERDIPLAFSPHLARGLDYYTGSIFEIIDLSQPDLGSISSGGRYDKLGEKFSRNPHPGVGGSIGLSRILKHLPEDCGQSPLPIVIMTEGTIPSHYIYEVAQTLRSETTQPVILYPQDGKTKFRRQIRYAHMLGAHWGVFIGSEEFEKRTITIRNLETGTQTTQELNQSHNILWEDIPPQDGKQQEPRT